MKIRVFTDGACSGNPGPGGWGAILLLPEGLQKISGYSKHTTNSRMEIMAVLKSLELSIKIGYKKIEIYSDSSYVVDTIEKKWIDSWKENNWRRKGSIISIKNKDLWVVIDKMIDKIKANNGKVKLIKVRGHSGNKYNDMADELAKREVSINRNE